MPETPESSIARPERLAVYAGVFDPPTLAHIEIIEIALRLFDRLTVVVAVNPSKAQALFSPDERVELIQASLTEGMRARVSAVSFPGLIAPYAARLGACALVRGMRPFFDPDFEMAQSLMNQRLAPELPTVLLVASARFIHLSSTFVRETAQLGGVIVSGSVSPAVEEALRHRFPGAVPSPDGLNARQPA